MPAVFQEPQSEVSPGLSKAFMFLQNSNPDLGLSNYTSSRLVVPESTSTAAQAGFSRTKVCCEKLIIAYLTTIYVRNSAELCGV
jgi:hypothetical protein